MGIRSVGLGWMYTKTYSYCENAKKSGRGMSGRGYPVGGGGGGIRVNV